MIYNLFWVRYLGLSEDTEHGETSVSPPQRFPSRRTGSTSPKTLPEPSTQADPAAVRAMVEGLIRDGFLIPLEEGARVEGTGVEDSRVMFKPNLLSRKPRTVPDQIWKALD